MNSHIPTKIISKRNQTPWISRRIKRLHKRKQRAFNSYKQHRDLASYETFSKQRKITYTETRNAHRSYISSICSDSPKRFWSYIKSLKVDNIGIPTLNNNNKLESDNRLKAEILNSQFKSVFTQENVHLPQEPSTNIPPMSDIIITTEGVAKLLHGLNPNKATGPDDIPARILQLAANELAPALQIIFQKSLDTGKLPLSWSQANIAPIFKKGDRSLAENYRPISLTSICCKILEHIIFTNIMNHFDCYSVLTDRQHGFRSKHSTESQLIITTQDLAQSLNKKLQVDMIILDFSKAFDTVPHNRLLNKLDRYGIRNKTHTWISNFLKYRKQRVVIGGEHSTWTQVMSGVPQGTVLGPLLFLTYINDLPNNINSSIRLFADDCVLYREIKNAIDSQELQKDLNSLMKWQMNFNPKKCFVMRLTHARHMTRFNYILGDKSLQETDNHPYLGVHKTIEKGCVSEMIRKLNLEPLNIRRTNKRLTIFHKAINGHLALPIGHLQPVLRRTRHLNSKAYNTIHTSKDCYKYSFFPRTIKDWNSLPDKIATIKEPHKFKFALAHFD